MTKTAINDKNRTGPSIHERSLMRLGCSTPLTPPPPFLTFAIVTHPLANNSSPLDRLRQTLGERLEARQQGLMVPAQTLKLVREIERRQNRQVD